MWATTKDRRGNIACPKPFAWLQSDVFSDHLSVREGVLDDFALLGWFAHSVKPGKVFHQFEEVHAVFLDLLGIRGVRLGLLQDVLGLLFT